MLESRKAQDDAPIEATITARLSPLREESRLVIAPNSSMMACMTVQPLATARPCFARALGAGPLVGPRPSGTAQVSKRWCRGAAGPLVLLNRRTTAHPARHRAGGSRLRRPSLRPRRRWWIGPSGSRATTPRFPTTSMAPWPEVTGVLWILSLDSRARFAPPTPPPPLFVFCV